jgi:hypothetical protein
MGIETEHSRLQATRIQTFSQARAAALGAVAGLTMLLTACGSDEAEPITTEPVATAPAEPGGEVENEPDTGETEKVDEIGFEAFSVEKYQDGEQLAYAFVDRQNEWFMSGGTPEDNAKRSTSMSGPQYATKIAKPFTDAYIETAYVSNWRDDESLSNHIEGISRDQAATVYGRLTTLTNNETPYERKTEATGIDVVLQDTEEIVVLVSLISRTNSEVVDQRVWGEVMNGNTFTRALTFMNEEGYWKLAAFDHK